MRITDFKYCGAGCGIYLIKNLINQKVYVGQTCRTFKERWTEHINLALNLKAKFNVTSIILALRKYGVENFDFSILEICPKEELDIREQFWIRAFNADSKDNYNQTAGGQNANLKYTEPDWVRALINDLKNSSLTVNELASKYEVSSSLVYDINSGKRYHSSVDIYPIRDLCRLKADNKIKLIKDICFDLAHTTLTLKQLATKYNVSLSYIKRINTGAPGYQDDEYTDHPIRVYIEPNQDYIEALCWDLQNTSISFKNLAVKYNISIGLIYNINKGTRKWDPNKDYPLRTK